MPTRRRLAFIIHGARAASPAMRHLVAWVRERGHCVEPHVTWERGDATRLARAAAESEPDAVVAVGGDGTVNEVINGLIDLETPLGIIPLGTANDFARQAGIPLDADHAMDIILHRNPVPIDTARVNGRRYLNASVGGVGAENLRVHLARLPGEP
ncbi:MAG TPA: diacylglycerol kinase family protein [Gemmatimonadaceae bacterium]|nr:diacylglycerol kinase family protein [Gemmatimonadaceae bacterium]